MIARCAICKTPRPDPEGWFEVSIRSQDTKALERFCVVCSWACMEIWMRRNTVVDPSKFEIMAMEHASAMGGEYLESIGQTDLAKMTVEQWQTFIEVVCGNFRDKHVDLVNSDDIPF